jgi:integrase
LKRAFLFGCLTGLRKSDIKQLTWQQIQPYTNGKMFVTTRMQKTKQIVHNPISDEAYRLLGERCEGLIFDGFKDKMLQGPLKRWLSTAGITKKITFHCTRHSFGSLHVEMGTDMLSYKPIWDTRTLPPHRYIPKWQRSRCVMWWTR